MESKPLHYDGSIQNVDVIESEVREAFELTDEMRKNISGNPYISN
ncbi:hypothetical protein [Metabacillus sp. FJAT-53654]|jgi:hypothetical protein|uniref:Uncharacterized protein n=1 Tax=Metabacillus rhizosphaerae TaxID=3117747 RepID=A0ABZ2MMY9_9BACI